MRPPAFSKREVAGRAAVRHKPLHLSGVGCGRWVRKNFRGRRLVVQQSRVESFVAADCPGERKMLGNSGLIVSAEPPGTVVVGQEGKAFGDEALRILGADRLMLRQGAEN